MQNYFLLILIIKIHGGFDGKVLNLNEIKYYEIVEPFHVGVHDSRRNRRDLSTFLPEEDKHLDETAFRFFGHNRNFLLNIFKNTFLIPESFVSIYQNSDGSYQFKKGIENCYYHGFLGDRVSSSAAVSTCNGLQGVIKDEDDEEFIIQPHPDQNDINSPKYILYKSRDVIVTEKLKCGVNHTEHSHHSKSNHDELYDTLNSNSFLTVEKSSVHQRLRRSPSYMKYIEIAVIMDNLEFKAYKTLNLTQHRGLEIMNFVDSYYKTVNTRIVVSYLIVWNVHNLATVSGKASETLNAIEDYTRDVLFGEMKLNFDNAQLITGVDWGGLAGLAGVNKICSYTSAAVNRDHGSAHATANTVAHEMGHNIGFMHYTCTCTTNPCVMSHSAPSDPCKGFADCTKEVFQTKLGNGELPCLLDYPDNFHQDPICGNGLLEKGEACDCGSKVECIASNSSKCCDFATCKLKASAQCAVGQCCHDCMFKQKGTLCREKMNLECDLEEYCTGKSSHCPDNFYIQDGGPCKNDTSYCYQGTCKTHDTQCEMLWGPNAMKADDMCFQVNLDSADGWGNCGKDSNGNYVKCAPGNQLCGKLQCRAKSSDVSLPTFPVIGTNRAKKTKTYYMGSTQVRCILGKTNVSPDMDDPTVTGPGIKCANNSICLSNNCTNISSLDYIKKCEMPCLNGGVCNNNGHCHCKKGFACPYCELSGPGGSEDSGAGCINEVECTDCLSSLTITLLIIFLLIVPLIILVVFLLYHYRHLIREKCFTQNGKVSDNAAPTVPPKETNNEQSVSGVDNLYMTLNQVNTSDNNPPSKPRPPPKPAKTGKGKVGVVC